MGLTAQHTRAHVIRAILEGVAFSLRDTLTIFRDLGVPINNSTRRRRGAARRCGGRFRPTCTRTKWKLSRQRKARRTVPRFLPPSVRATSLRWMKLAM